MRSKLFLLGLSVLALASAQAQEGKRPPSVSRPATTVGTTTSATTRTAASATAATDAPLRGLYGQTAPTANLEQADLQAFDAGRGRAVSFRATRPAGPGRWPVIIWSHGLFGSQDNYQPLVQHWARHGYLVLQPSHTDSLRRGDGRLREGMSGNTKDWAGRAGDVSFLLDQAASHPSLAPHADLSRVGIGGHSFGAQTASLLAGAQPAVGPSLREERAKAFLIVSPQGEGRLLTSSSWKGFQGPALFITGDNDSSPRGETAEWRLESFEGVPAGEKSLMWIHGAHHHFGGISGAKRRRQTPNPDHVELVKAASLALWDAHLKSDAEAQQAMRTGDVGAGKDRLYRWQTR